MRLAPTVVALLLALAASPARGGAPFTAGLDFDAALAKARAEGKLLLVDVSVPGWDDCEQMDKATWPDAAVGEWITGHALAIQLSAFASPGVVGEYGLENFPTVLLFRDGKELDRHTGPLLPDAFVAWGDAALAGQTENAAVAGRARELLASDDVEERAGAAFDCVNRGLDELARQHLLWLWQHTDHDVDWSELRASFLPQAMARVAKRDATARTAFLEILEKADTVMAKADHPELVRWNEWIALCVAFEQGSRLLTWYQAHRDEQGRLFAQDPPSDELTEKLQQMFGGLFEAGHAVEAVRLFPDLHALLADVMQSYHGMIAPDLSLLSGEEAESWKKAAQASLRSQLSQVQAGLRGADRSAEAADWAAALLGALDDAESRLALVRSTLDIAPDRTVGLATWLDQAEKRGADVAELRARLSKAMPAAAVPAPPAGG